ncbi:MAG: hypothetical protein B6D59_00890 [Campylobacteraceae bacterium 4484_4]|nr:MAG: hypothetical protein B6D59_00890 [Campylobacteraceae bacterium 4484_4]
MRGISWIWLLLLLAGCGESDKSLTQERVVKEYAIELLSQDIFYFPAKKESNESVVYQPLQPLDFIFVGHDSNSSESMLANVIPGHYTHMLMYLGKDEEGFAYGVEMNTEENAGYQFDAQGVRIDGRLFVYCLGSDFGEKECPQDLYHFGLETYDYMWARRLKPSLHERLSRHRGEIVSTIRQDLVNRYPIQIPFHFGIETPLTKILPLVDDGRENGADCTAYFVSLLEEVAGICLQDVRIDAAQLQDYYLNDPVGKEAVIPAEYNPLSAGDLHISDLFSKMGYSIADTTRQTACEGDRNVTGIPIPDRLYHSPDMVDIVP